MVNFLTNDQQMILRDARLRLAFVGVELIAVKDAIKGIQVDTLIEIAVLPTHAPAGEHGVRAWIIGLDNEPTTMSPLSRLT